jgi:signal peptidase I
MRAEATWLGWIGQVLAWLVILGVVAALAVAVLVPRLAGATPFTVLTGSMRPSLPPGTLVVVKSKAAEELRVGDVITYQLESGQSAVVTHRITSVATNLKGESTFTTKGDYNDVADAKPVRPVQIRGELLYAVPTLGYASNLISGSQRQVATYGLVTLLLGYAAFMAVGAIRDRRAARSSIVNTSRN